MVSTTPATRAAVTAAVLRALELAAELLPVRVWGVVGVSSTEDENRKRNKKGANDVN